jgi:hypothetical protein
VNGTVVAWRCAATGARAWGFGERTIEGMSRNGTPTEFVMTRSPRRVWAFVVRGVVLGLMAGLLVAGCGRSTATADLRDDSLRKTVEGLVHAARTAGMDGDTTTADGVPEWNEVISLMRATAAAVTQVVFIDGDVFALVLDAGEFTPFGGQTITAVQISDNKETWCYRLGATEALVAKPCLVAD